MSADTLDRAANETSRAAAAAAERGQKALNDTLAAAQQTIAEAARVAERALKEGSEIFREQTRSLRENAGQQIDDAQRYVVGQVRERPIAAALTGLGVGVLVGLLLSSRKQ